MAFIEIISGPVRQTEKMNDVCLGMPMVLRGQPWEGISSHPLWFLASDSGDQPCLASSLLAGCLTNLPPSSQAGCFLCCSVVMKHHTQGNQQRKRSIGNLLTVAEG